MEFVPVIYGSKGSQLILSQTSFQGFFFLICFYQPQMFLSPWLANKIYHHVSTWYFQNHATTFPQNPIKQCSRGTNYVSFIFNNFSPLMCFCKQFYNKTVEIGQTVYMWISHNANSHCVTYDIIKHYAHSACQESIFDQRRSDIVNSEDKVYG